MFSTLFSTNILLGGLIFGLLQLAVALPWWFAFDSSGVRAAFKVRTNPGILALIIFAVVGFASSFLSFENASSNLDFYGRAFGAILAIQLEIDLFIYGPYLLALVFPKAGAVALAAYREAWRQPTFWMIGLAGCAATWIAVYLPYFTFGDDFKMFKHIGYDIIMLSALLFGVLASSMSIAEEIEGRTAITVMSKPITRRSFLLGKFLGVLMACGAMSILMLNNFNAAVEWMPELDQINKDRSVEPMTEQAKGLVIPAVTSVVPNGAPTAVAQGIGRWFAELGTNGLGLLLVFGQVMILVAASTAIATRLPFVVNLVIVLFVYLFGHLAPVVVRVSQQSHDGNETARKLVGFLAQLFDTLLPALEFFNMGPAINRDTPIDLWDFALYVAFVFGYSLIYTMIALVVGLLLFEDRDLA
jgi:ABC-type transport system involved in multi-copper enzyme maturation permease subunit